MLAFRLLCVSAELKRAAVLRQRLPKKPPKFFLKKHFRFIFPLPFCRKVCYNEYIRGLSAEFPPRIAYIIKFSTWRVNTMKKLLAIILAALMLVPMLAACDRSGTQKGD